MIHKIREGIVFFGLSFLIALSGAEAALRVMNRAEAGGAANIIRPEDVDLTFNRAGFRDRDYAERKDPGVFRILVSGNSATFGVSVGSRQTYVKQLEELLNKGHTPSRFEVINAGVPAWNILYQKEFLESRGIGFDPDLILIGYTLNSAEGFYVPPEDLFTAGSKYEGSKEVLHRSPREWASPLLAHRDRHAALPLASRLTQEVKLWCANHSHLYRYLRWRYDLTQQPFQSRDYPKSLYYQEAAEHWIPCREALKAIGQTFRAHRIPAVLVVFPFFVNLKSGPGPGQGYRWEDLHALVASAGHEAGMTVIDLLPVFRGWDPRDISVDPYHMNPTGHRLAAEAIYNALAQSRLIPGE
jgi:hypothetical protein